MRDIHPCNHSSSNLNDYCPGTIAVLVRHLRNFRDYSYRRFLLHTDTLGGALSLNVNHQLEFKRSAFMYTWCCLIVRFRRLSLTLDKKYPQRRLAAYPAASYRWRRFIYFLTVKSLDKWANRCSLLGENINSDRNIFKAVDCCCWPSITTQGLIPETRNRKKKVSESPNCDVATRYLQIFIVLPPKQTFYFYLCHCFSPSNEGCRLHISSTAALEQENLKRKEYDDKKEGETPEVGRYLVRIRWPVRSLFRYWYCGTY